MNECYKNIEFDIYAWNLLVARELDKHKWLMSERAGYDIGEKAYDDWIEMYLPDFRRSHRNEYV